MWHPVMWYSYNVTKVSEEDVASIHCDDGRCTRFHWNADTLLTNYNVLHLGSQQLHNHGHKNPKVSYKVHIPNTSSHVLCADYSDTAQYFKNSVSSISEMDKTMYRFHKNNKVCQEEITCCQKISFYGLKRFYLHMRALAARAHARTHTRARARTHTHTHSSNQCKIKLKFCRTNPIVSWSHMHINAYAHTHTRTHNSAVCQRQYNNDVLTN
jgi:hypothetical protein